MKKLISSLVILTVLLSCQTKKEISEQPIQVSGIYPHLAMYNSHGECGTGAVVPWADRLWVITYGPHLPNGSSDKLYEITPNLEQIVREESIGGTPANRMIHKESDQLFIGPYAIDAERNVRAIPYSKMSGRHTGNARHLTDSANKIYYATMEEGFYEVDVKTLEVKELYKDGNSTQKKGDMTMSAELLVGAHGKGLYSGQGVMVYSNNGEAVPEALTNFNIESGVLAEWNGKDWKVVRRNQFVEVTGPGGIYGNENLETDPVWATGWDYKSIILGVRDNGEWSFFRLPKTSNSYDGAHGWYTEWPRIRNVGTSEKPDFLMTMHGMFWSFPGTFTSSNTAGIRPRSAYLKIIGDFTRWNNQLVFGCDDAANSEKNNKRNVKGEIDGYGQSNSNLWFTPLNKPDKLGTATAQGAVWISEEISAGEISEPFLFAGWDTRLAWVKNEGIQTNVFRFEVDELGNNKWEIIKSVTVNAGESVHIPFEVTEKGEWIRVSVESATKATVVFNYTENDLRDTKPNGIFEGLADVNESKTNAGLLYGLGKNRRSLGVLSGIATDKSFSSNGYYELDSTLNLEKKEDPEMAAYISENLIIPQNVITIDDASVLIVDESGRRWRLPKGNPKFADLTGNSVLRLCREVVTQRDLFNCCGTFYELPNNNADGFAKIRPVSSHNFRIHDFTSYRGLLVMTGINPDAKASGHIIRSADGEAAVWVGVIDDLWKMGKTTGHGGPWKNSQVEAGVHSDPYLIGYYDKRKLEISHQSEESVSFKIEVDPIGHAPWMLYKEVTINPGETFNFVFPENFEARWIRFVSNKNCIATTLLTYN